MGMIRYGALRCVALRDAESRRVVVGRPRWLVVLLLRVRG